MAGCNRVWESGIEWAWNHKLSRVELILYAHEGVSNIAETAVG